MFSIDTLKSRCLFPYTPFLELIFAPMFASCPGGLALLGLCHYGLQAPISSSLAPVWMGRLLGTRILML